LAAVKAAQVDPADVATVEALEPKVKELIEAIDAADSALERLEAANYPGAGIVAWHASRGVAENPRNEGGLACLAYYLRAFRKA
jgi:hypothetical protein